MSQKHLQYLFALFVLLTLPAAYAGETRRTGQPEEAGISVGAGVAVSTSPYESYDTVVLPMPLVMYDSDRLYLKGASAGVHILKNEKHTVSAGVSYFGHEFDPDDTDSAPHKKLDKRRSTLMADVSYALTTPVGIAKLKVAGDVLGKSDGFVADARFSVPILRDKLTVVPSAGVEWSSENQTDYYYGISRAESARSGLKQHEASAAFSPYLNVDVKYQLTDRWSAVAGANIRFLTGDIKDSPMTDKSVTVGGFLGALFTF